MKESRLSSLSQRLLWSTRVVVFYTLVIPWTISFGTLAVLLICLPDRARYFILTLWCKGFIGSARLILGLHYRIMGKEWKSPTACVCLSNHQSLWETVFFPAFLGHQTWVLKKELLQIPFFGWGLRLLKPIAIHRRSPKATRFLLEQGKQRLQSGIHVFVYPEGTRVAPGVVKPFKITGSQLAFLTGTPVQPIAHNAGAFWPKGWFPKQAGCITIRILPLIHPKDYPDLGSFHAAIEGCIRSKMV